VQVSVAVPTAFSRQHLQPVAQIGERHSALRIEG
jgi:hypothetical protein